LNTSNMQGHDTYIALSVLYTILLQKMHVRSLILPSVLEAVNSVKKKGIIVVYVRSRNFFCREV